MHRLLVTGGAGFIGSNFVQYWLQRHPHDRVVVLDALTYAGNPANLAQVRDHEGFRFIHGNICDTSLVENVLQEENVDTLVHFAAESHVDRSIAGPDEFIETNILGTHSLLKAARKVWLTQAAVPSHRFHHVSTDEVYGSLGRTEPGFSESTPYAPNSPYSASKAASDHLVRAYHHTYGLNVTTSNCSNNYGPFHCPEKLIPLIVVNILLGRRLPIYGDGSNIRDWLHVSDHCRGIELILATGKAGEVYNIGGRAECDNLSIVKRLCAVADEFFYRDASLATRFPDSPASRGGKSSELICFVSDRLGHDQRYAIDCSKAERELGFVPEVSLEEGLSGVFDWYLANEKWWRDFMDGSYAKWIETNYLNRPDASADRSVAKQ